MGGQPVEFSPMLAKARCVNPRLRRGAALAYLVRLSALLAVALQKAVVAAVLRAGGADLPTTWLEEAPAVADLPLV